MDFCYPVDYKALTVDGNDLPENIRINQFLQKYIEAFEKHDSGIYDKETYDILVDAYRKILNK